MNVESKGPAFTLMALTLLRPMIVLLLLDSREYVYPLDSWRPKEALRHSALGHSQGDGRRVRSYRVKTIPASLLIEVDKLSLSMLL